MNDTTQDAVVEAQTEVEPIIMQEAEPPAHNLPIPGDTEPQTPVPPFGLLLKKLLVDKKAYFEPSAAILLTAALRTSGLLKILPAEECKTLLWIFTFLTPNGDIVPAASQLAEAMGVSEAKAKARLEKLQETSWQGEPIVQHMARENGLDAYVPAPTLFAIEEAGLPAEESAGLPYRPAGREAVITQSRAQYARPRAEVEAMIAQQMGWEELGEPATPEEAVLVDTRQRLRLLGLTKDEVDTLVARFPIERIQRQLYYLPYRHAKSPARFLMAAIESDYEPPLALRHKPTDEQAVSSLPREEAPLPEHTVAT